MNAVERLRRDHQLFRSKLDVLEVVLKTPGDTWFVLREVCFTLARQLRDHIRREEELTVACRKSLSPRILAEVVVEHRDEPEHLRAVNRMFISETGHSMARIKPALAGVIKGLRRHMAEEERELFPIFERTLKDVEAQTALAPQPEGRLSETMTVNRVIHEFPKTKAMLERLLVNIPVEGCHCLDEVAWRHGIDSRDLVKTLEAAIASCECEENTASAPPAADATSTVREADLVG